MFTSKFANVIKLTWRLCLCATPWRLRRWLLCRIYRYQIHPTARIGAAWVFPTSLTLGENTAIGSLTVIKNLDNVVLSPFATIGRLNWISAHPKCDRTHYADQPDRDSSLYVGTHAAITHRHLIDCTDRVSIGEYSIVAGYRSQILTHGIDIAEGRQACKGVAIGPYCFVGTGAILLAGSVLPPHAVLAAGAVLTRPHSDSHTIYAGVPARPIAKIPPTARYFHRTSGYVL